MIKIKKSLLFSWRALKDKGIAYGCDEIRMWLQEILAGNDVAKKNYYHYTNYSGGNQ